MEAGKSQRLGAVGCVVILSGLTAQSLKMQVMGLGVGGKEMTVGFCGDPGFGSG